MKVAIAVTVALFAIARMYLAVDGPSDVLYGLIRAWRSRSRRSACSHRTRVFPVVYRKGSTAHLDVTGRRGEAIRRRSKSSSGSRCEDRSGRARRVGRLDTAPVEDRGRPRHVSLREALREESRARRPLVQVVSNRPVRLPRGRGRFQSVRRFVEYEDYTLRLLRDEGLPVPAPRGIVEIEPEREYMILMEFFEGAEEIGIRRR